MTKKLFLFLLTFISAAISAAKIEFPISDKKLAGIRKNHKVINKFFGLHNAALDSDIQYDINLMWINKELKEEQKGIHPEDAKLIAPVLNWASRNEDSVVNVWFDSQSTSEKSIQNTLAKLNRYSGLPTIAPIVLKDIRTLSKVQENTVVFSDLRIPVYFKADLARAIVLDNTITGQSTDQYSVYSDLDIKPISKECLFDEQTLENLKKYGLVMAKYESTFENGFQIISNHKPNLIRAHKIAIIDANIARALNALGNTAHKNVRYEKPVDLAQVVYGSYQSMFEYSYQLEECGRCVMKKDGTEYNIDKHGLEPFGRFGYAGFTFQPKDKWCMDNKFNPQVIIPKKEVNYPPLSYKYYS